jgi:hypothetical protein
LGAKAADEVLILARSRRDDKCSLRFGKLHCQQSFSFVLTIGKPLCKPMSIPSVKGHATNVDCSKIVDCTSFLETEELEGTWPQQTSVKAATIFSQDHILFKAILLFTKSRMCTTDSSSIWHR